MYLCSSKTGSMAAHHNVTSSPGKSSAICATPCWLAMTQAICNLAGLPLVRNAFRQVPCFHRWQAWDQREARFCHSMKERRCIQCVHLQYGVHHLCKNGMRKRKRCRHGRTCSENRCRGGSPARNTVAITILSSCVLAVAVPKGVCTCFTE